MPRVRPATTGYERLEQADHSSDDSDDDFLGQSSTSMQDPRAPRYNHTSQPRPHSGMTSPKPHVSSGTGRPGGSKNSRGRRVRSNSSVDVKAINARLEKWAEEIASKFKRGKRGKNGDDDDERLEIHHSVFQAPEGVRPATAESLAMPQEGVMTKEEFEVIIESVRVAIDHGVQPLMISQGSSGSYFARNPDGKVVGVFKPKDEEPYAAGNPKWNKWIHRNLFPCCFGRAWTDEAQRSKRRRWADNCRPTPGRAQEENAEDGYESPERSVPGPGNFRWTESLKQGFREELEKLVILDYIMRNTDRGLDNWMIKVDWQTEEVSIVSEPPQFKMDTAEPEDGPRPVDLGQRKTQGRSSYPYKAQRPMEASSPTERPRDPKITIGAIDNSLSWPWKHPDAWRRPFSQKTRDHFLPLLTSTAWWSQTQLALRKVFQLDPDFQEKMFSRQIAVMKGQAWNVVETLKTPDHGPLELTRRAKVCVWDDLVEVPVAVPMRVTSAEMRRRTDEEIHKAIEEEMDIGAAKSSSKPVTDLLGLATPPADIPHPGRFELSGHITDTAIDETQSMEDSLVMNDYNTSDSSPTRNKYDRPRISHANVGTSYPGPHRSHTALNADPPPKRERRYSYATVMGRRNSTLAQQMYGYDDDDVEGDLGYAAAEGMEGNQRKVIVERLEPVKARNPVFTWC
ncbi:Phosphatidylinositol 4-kinase LSB6 [Cytospora paraplurivora]|uniref:Phosphatidylinositol 4-kinase n=1 Tax=Cytospora paraplurivora TaxID=2898453 RepID=A0AAN9U2U4_9PEZI